MIKLGKREATKILPKPVPRAAVAYGHYAKNLIVWIQFWGFTEESHKNVQYYMWRRTFETLWSWINDSKSNNMNSILFVFGYRVHVGVSCKFPLGLKVN